MLQADGWRVSRRDVGNVGWSGDELVAFRLHLPSRVPFHNPPSHEIERGNIIAWEQPLAARLKGEPVDIEVHMETESILVRTLTLFASRSCWRWRPLRWRSGG